MTVRFDFSPKRRTFLKNFYRGSMTENINFTVLLIGKTILQSQHTFLQKYGLLFLSIFVYFCLYLSIFVIT